MNGFFGLLIAVAIVWVASGFVIWIVSKLGLGLEVDGFGSALIAAIVIAVIAGIITWLVTILGIQEVGEGLIGGVVHLFISAVVLLVGARFLPGLKVAGFAGALVAAVAIGAFYWLGGQVLGLMF
jgi:putative membrane protein